MNRIYLCLAHMSGNEQKFIQEAFDTNWVVPLGPNVNGFEQDLSDFLNSKDNESNGIQHQVCALSSGTAAIHLGLILLDVKSGDEVICQSFTFAASANPVTYLGAQPVFVDSEPDTWNMDPKLLEEAIVDRISKTGKKPKAIVAVHLYGMPCKMNEILEISKKYDIPVLEDAAEAIGSQYNGAYCGTLGKLGVLSFNGNKMITTSGGGALICKTVEEKQKITFFATQAREAYPYYQHEQIGYNYRMSNICAGIGRGQMSVLDDHIKHHQWVLTRYKELLADIPEIKVHLAPADGMSLPNYWLTTVTIEGFSIRAVAGKKSLLKLIENMSERGVETRALWQPMHRQPGYRNAPSYINGVSDQLFDCGLCLPSGPWVKEEELQYISEALHHLIQD